MGERLGGPVPQSLRLVQSRFDFSIDYAGIIYLMAAMANIWFLTKTLPKVATKSSALSVLAYNLTRVMNIVGTKPLMAVRDLRPNRSWLLKTSLERGFYTAKTRSGHRKRRVRRPLSGREPTLIPYQRAGDLVSCKSRRCAPPGS